MVSRTWLKERRIFTQNVFLVQLQTLLEVNEIFVQFNCLSSDRNDFVWKRPVSVINDSLSLEGARNPRGILGLIFVGYVPLASQNPYPIIVYSVANYRTPSWSLLGKYAIFAIPT